MREKLVRRLMCARGENVTDAARRRLGTVVFCSLAALTIACAEDESNQEVSALGHVAQAVTLPSFGSSCSSAGNCTVEITVPQGIPEMQFALAGESFVHVNDRAEVYSRTGTTPVISSGNDWSRIGADATVGHFISPNHILQVGPTNSRTRRSDGTLLNRVLYGDLYSGSSSTDLPLTRQMAQERTSVQGQVIEGSTNPRQPAMEMLTHSCPV